MAISNEKRFECAYSVKLYVNFTSCPCEHIHAPVNVKTKGCSIHIVSLIKYLSCSICFVPTGIC